jgi:hypothetical protein
MKFTNFYILGGALVLLIILTASCGCYDFKPHSKKVSFARYEGMEDLDEDDEVEGFDEDDEMEGFDEDDEVEGFDEDDEMEGFNDEDDEMEGFDEDEEIEGFEDEEKEENENGKIKNEFSGSMGQNKKEGMMSIIEPRPYSEDTLYDIYGPPTMGSPDCGARSAGLSNSKGPLCLSDSQLNMLQTRGGNATTDSQIGA